MCFSAEASLTAGAALLIGGAYAVRRAGCADRALIPVAAYPLAFGIQQLVEGALWVELTSPAPESAGALALAFLFFSHFFWPLWAPLSIYWLLRGTRRAPVLRSLTALGALIGGLLFVPLLLAGGVPVGIADGHIAYGTNAIYGGSIPPTVILVAYGLVALLPFALSGRRWLQAFGALLLLSMLAAYGFYAVTLISVWCFFAALISGMVAVAIALHERKPRAAVRRPASG